MIPRRLAAALLAATVPLAAGRAAAEPFAYLPPGDLIPGSGQGRADEVVYAPGMRFPIEEGPAFANSQVYNKGGVAGPAGGQCDATNYDYPWRDNYCETRQWDMPLCPAGTGHQGQDIRPPTCQAGVHWAVAAADGTITSIGSYSVYLTDDDGTRYDYLHMSDVQVSVGQAVTRGERIGKVSNVFGGTPTTIHLHFNLRQNVSGIGAVYVPPYTSLIAAYEVLLDSPPEGSLDSVECDGIRGWTRDPDTPDAPASVLLSFDGAAGEPGAGTFLADVYRDDLCAALGSCEHGFEVPLPLSLLGTDPHEVSAHGMSTGPGPEAELAGSPRSFSCALSLPEGVRRLVSGDESMAAWRFSTFWDVATAPDDALLALPEGQDLPIAPELAQADDGAPDLWLIDGGYRRLVPDAEVATAWELDINAAATWPADELDALSEGPPLRPRPFLLRGTGEAVYLLDDPLPSAGPGSPGAGGEAGDNRAETGAFEGEVRCDCGVLGGRRAPATGAFAAAAAAALLAARRRRRR